MLNIHQELEAKMFAIKRMSIDSLFFFSKEVLSYPDINIRTHGDIIAALEAPTRRKLICVPRGSLKSTVCCISYPIWLLLRNPNLRILIDSELYTNSKNFLREIKGHLESSWMSTLFGEFKSNVWNESEIIVKQRKIIRKEASITVGGVGTTKVGQHFDIIIGDDYNSDKNSITEEGRKKVVAHYRYNQSILEPMGTYVIVGTRYSEDDVIGTVIKNEIEINKEVST